MRMVNRFSSILTRSSGTEFVTWIYNKDMEKFEQAKTKWLEMKSQTLSSIKEQWSLASDEAKQKVIEDGALIATALRIKDIQFNFVYNPSIPLFFTTTHEKNANSLIKGSSTNSINAIDDLQAIEIIERLI